MLTCQAVRIAQQHLGRPPGPGGERMLHGAGPGRLEAVRVVGPDQRLDLRVRPVGALDHEQVYPAGRMFQPAGVAAGLELHPVTERLPERDGPAPVAGLDDEPLDPVRCHAVSLGPCLAQVTPQRGGGDRRERLLGVDGVIFDLADEIRRQVHLELSHLVSHEYYGTIVLHLACGPAPGDGAHQPLLLDRAPGQLHPSLAVAAKEPADSGVREVVRVRAGSRLGLGRHGLFDLGQRRSQQPQVRGGGRAGLGPPVH